MALGVVAVRRQEKESGDGTWRDPLGSVDASGRGDHSVPWAAARMTGFRSRPRSTSWPRS